MGKLVTLAACLAMAPAAFAEETLSTVRVYADPPTARFRVDGTSYSGPATFLWPAGSKHTLTTDELQTGVLPGRRFRFSRWMANSVSIAPLAAVVTVTADPAISSFRAEFSTEYALSLGFNPCESPCVYSPGTVYVNQAPYTQDTVLWFGAGAVVQLQAVPAAGYVFVGWVQAAGSISQGFLNTVAMTEPRGAYPRFEVARRITLATSPPGLRVMADRTVVYTPIVMEWGWNTTHTLAPVSPQLDQQGKSWVFASWSDAPGSLRSYKVAKVIAGDEVVASFVPGFRVSFLTDPPGLKLLVDGRDNWTGAYNYDWGAGESHRVEAPETQTGGDGRKYVFHGWSNGGARVQEVTVAANARLTAAYEMLGRVTVQSTLANVVVRVNGEDCAVPCTVDRPRGVPLRVTAPASVAAGEESRWDFQGWGDMASAERTITPGAEPITVRAAYALKNRLQAVSEPEGGARWKLEPTTVDGFYERDAIVSVSVEAAPGFRFRRWEGDLGGSFTSGTLPMSAPRAVRAVFEKVPYLPSAAVRNAVADTAADGVAPGSVISILGLNLAERSETGPASPLAQTLAGVTVRMGERLLPLFSVSPDRIDAHLPHDVEPGMQALAVRSGSLPEVTAKFTVLRNAPGLFAAGATRTGDTVTLLGTGLGPYQLLPIQGFAIPDSPRYWLEDPVEVLAGDEVIAPLSAGAQPGLVGVDAIVFRPPEGATRFAIRVNGSTSNWVTVE